MNDSDLISRPPIFGPGETLAIDFVPSNSSENEVKQIVTIGAETIDFSSLNLSLNDMLGISLLIYYLLPPH